MSRSIARSKYQKTLTQITTLYNIAKRSVVMFYWGTGKHLVEVEQNGDVKAAYGKELLKKLSADLTRNCGPDAGFSVPNLQRMRRFYLSRPKYSTSTNLSWSQHVELMPLKDKRARARLEQRTAKEGLTARDIRRLVKEARGIRKPAVSASPPAANPAPAKKFPPLKAPAGLKLNTYCKITEAQAPGIIIPVSGGAGKGQTILDCGFFVCLVIPKAQAGSLTVTDRPSYTYAATVERIVDGDTLKAVIKLGFGIFVRHKLRLRGINTPEMGTPEGRKAKRYVESLLPAGSPLILKSHRTDIYGRFVADVFYGPGAKSRPLKGEGLTYLNQNLLDEGLAVRMAE